MTKKGILTVISGFSGAGKGTIVRELVDRYGYAVSISATTRDPRAGEQDGVHYFFKTKEEFEQMIADGALIEYASYVDNYYGTPKDYVMQKLEQGIDVILEIEMQGALKVKERFPEVSLIFITPPDAKVLRERLEGRGTETQDVIESSGASLLFPHRGNNVPPTWLFRSALLQAEKPGIRPVHCPTIRHAGVCLHYTAVPHHRLFGNTCPKYPYAVPHRSLRDNTSVFLFRQQQPVLAELHTVL